MFTTRYKNTVGKSIGGWLYVHKEIYERQYGWALGI